MGYDIYDMNGYVGRLGSATATCLLNEYLEKKGGREFHKFVNTGKVKKTPKLLKEIVNLPVSEDPDTRSMVEHFVSLIIKSQGVILLSDGTNIDIRYIFDTKGIVGELCWPSEVPLLNKYLKKYGGDLLKELVKKGTVKKTSKLMKEFDALPVSKDPYIQDLVEKLIILTKKSKKIITITDGFDDDNVGEGPQILYIP